MLNYFLKTSYLKSYQIENNNLNCLSCPKYRKILIIELILKDIYHNLVDLIP